MMMYIFKLQTIVDVSDELLGISLLLVLNCCGSFMHKCKVFFYFDVHQTSQKHPVYLV
jgi:hypothetical protein